jgi:hypothetical protein
MPMVSQARLGDLTLGDRHRSGNQDDQNPAASNRTARRPPSAAAPGLRSPGERLDFLQGASPDDIDARPGMSPLVFRHATCHGLSS